MKRLRQSLGIIMWPTEEKAERKAGLRYGVGLVMMRNEPILPSGIQVMPNWQARAKIHLSSIIGQNDKQGSFFQEDLGSQEKHLLSTIKHETPE
jgi:hypothetical protein